MGVGWYELENGMDAIVEQKGDLANTYVFYTLRTGEESQRDSEQEGLHIIEHRFFRSGSVARTIEDNATQSEKLINTGGGTSFGYCYGKFDGPEKHTRPVFQTARDALCGMDHDLEQFTLEKQIIHQELRQRQSDEISPLADDLTLARIYRGTRFARTLDQSIANVMSLTPTKVLRLRERLFRPSNISVIVIGPLPERELRDLAAEYFGSLFSRRKPLQKYNVALPPPERFRIDMYAAGLTIPFVAHTARIGPLDDKEGLRALAESTLLRDILAEREDVSSLYRGLRIERGALYVPHGFVVRRMPEPLFQIEYFCDDRFVESNIAYVEGELTRFATTRLGHTAVRAASEFAVADFRQDIDDGDERGEWYVNNAAAELFITPRDFVEALRGVTAERLRRRAEALLSSFGTTVLHPTGQPLLTSYQPALVNSSLPEGTPGSDTSSMPDPVILNPS